MADEPEMMRCERRAASLLRRACARDWEAAQTRRPDPWEWRWHCRSCPIGAAVAGKPLTSVATDALADVCQRCLRRSARLIRGRLCVSCYNREREARIGRNAKGTRPRIADLLHAQTLAVVEDSAVFVKTVGPVVGLVEAMVTTAKAAAGRPVAFGRARPVFSP